MAFVTIPLGLIQGGYFSSGRVLKTYLANTTTPTPLYTDYTGTTPTATVLFDANGLPTVSGQVIMPHMDTRVGRVKFVLYPDQTSADGDTGALETIDNISSVDDDVANIVETVEVQLGSQADGSNIFTLTNSYTPGNQSLVVIRNGQTLISGLAYDYVELSATTVQLNYAPNANDRFVFRVGAQLTAGSVVAEAVSYLPAGTGAQATNVREVLRRVIYGQDFGIVADGVTNDTAALNAALVAARGGTLLLPKGTILTDGGHTISDTTIIKGMGLFDTILQLSGTNTGANMFVYAANSDGSALHDLQLRGNWDGTTTPTAWGKGVSQSGVCSVLHGSNVLIQLFTGEAMKITGGIKHDFTNFNLQSCGLDALHLDAASNPITNVTMRGGSMQSMRRSLLRCAGGAGVNIVSGVRLIGVAQFIAPIWMRFANTNSCDHVQVIGGYVEDITNTPIWVDNNAPLDSEDSGATGIGTGGSLSIIGTNCVSDAIGQTNIRSTAYRWIASGSGTNEYYCELAAGGDPSLVNPDGVRIDERFRTRNTPGVLGVGQFGYGDNDSLGFSTVYVRLDTGVDPDTAPNNFIQHFKAWAIPTNQATIASIQIIGAGVLPRPLEPAGASDANVFWDLEQGAKIEARVLAAYPNGVDRLLAKNTASLANAGIAQASVAAFNASGNLERAYFSYDGSSRTAKTGFDPAFWTYFSTGELRPSGTVNFLTNRCKFNESDILGGTGSPEGVVTAVRGSLFLRQDGGAGTTLYVKETLAGNTGWVAK